MIVVIVVIVAIVECIWHTRLSTLVAMEGFIVLAAALDAGRAVTAYDTKLIVSRV